MLRLIALDRVLHVVILTFLAVAFVTFATHNRALHTDYQNIMNALNGGGAAALRVRGVLGYLRKAFDYTPTHLFVLAAIFLAYACLEAVEAVGLWFNRRWAEYLTFVATTLLIPYEIYELVPAGQRAEGAGLRGQRPGGRLPAVGQATVRRPGRPRRRGGTQAELSGWSALEASPPPGVAGGPRDGAGRLTPAGGGPSAGVVRPGGPGGIVVPHGPLAQLVAHLHDTQGVVGSR